MSKELFYATNNPGKKYEVSKHLSQSGIIIKTPDDYGINIDITESGNSLEENAILKVKIYSDLVKNKIILADDTGLEIEALKGEPGIHVRRWKDKKTRMSDQEIIDYCLEKMKGIPKKERGAQFRTVLALNVPGGEIEIFDGILKGYILEKAAIQKIEGFPFESLFFVPEWKMLLGEARQLPAMEKERLLNHRENAIDKAVPRIKELLKD